MKKLELFEDLLSHLQDPHNKSTKLSINHCHVRGIFSLVVKGTEPGKLTRIFINEKKLKPYEVQLHTHRYPINLTVIKGDITQHCAVEDETAPTKMCEYIYRSPLNGGNGLTYNKEVNVKCYDFKMPIGSSTYMRTDEYHTMSASKNSMWIVEELGFEPAESKVLGIPFIVDGLYSEPAMFQINDRIQTVTKALKEIINAYKLV